MEFDPWKGVKENIINTNEESLSIPSSTVQDTIYKQRIRIYWPENHFSSLSIESYSAAINAFAAVIGALPEEIEVYRVNQGSIVLELGIPLNAIQYLRSLLQSNSVQLRVLEVERVIFSRPNFEETKHAPFLELKRLPGKVENLSVEIKEWAGEEEWIFEGGKFQNVSEIERFGEEKDVSWSKTFPKIIVPPHILLTSEEKALLQQVYRGLVQVLIEKEFGESYNGTRVLQTRPIRTDGIPIARRITKLGPATELSRECTNYMQYVEPFLPYSAARVEWENYFEQDGQAGFPYTFMGGSLERVTDLAEYYHQASDHTAERIIKLLNNLLHHGLGQSWYNPATPLICFFAQEYGPRMIEHLRLRLRPASPDALWLLDQPPTTASSSYQKVAPEAIPRQYQAIQPSALVTIEGMVVRRLGHNTIILDWDISGVRYEGVVVSIELMPYNDVPQYLGVGSVVGVRGEVIYNQLGRMTQIIGDAFSDLSFNVDSKSIKLSDAAEIYSNPLQGYSQVLNKILEGRQSYTHGNLHLHNILVDEWGKGWLIDFSLVKKHHNIFDFIKLETSLRLMVLAKEKSTFSLDDYLQFEKALVAATLNNNRIKQPNNLDLQTAYEVILAIRQIAQHYMMDKSSFLDEYFPALFLYCLSVMKYYRKDAPQPIRLTFITACVLGRYLLEE